MPQTKLLKIDKETKSFQANGKTYYVEESISFDRWEKYLEFNVELGWDCTIPEMAKALGQIYNHLNDQNFADAAVLTRDKMMGLKQMSEKKIPAALKLCALFVNEEKEDRRFINEDMISKKVEDWKQEGIDVAGFFQLALHIIPGYMESLKKNIQGTLTH